MAIPVEPTEWHDLLSGDDVVVSYRQHDDHVYEIALKETSQRAVRAHLQNVTQIALSHPPKTDLFFLVDMREGTIALQHALPHMREEQRKLADKGKFTWAILVHKRPFIAMIESVLQSIIHLDHREYFTDYDEALTWITEQAHHTE